MILMKLLLNQRPDYKVIANFLLHRLDPLRPYIMPVNPFEDHKEAMLSLQHFNIQCLAVKLAICQL